MAVAVVSGVACRAGIYHECSAMLLRHLKVSMADNEKVAREFRCSAPDLLMRVVVVAPGFPGRTVGNHDLLPGYFLCQRERLRPKPFNKFLVDRGTGEGAGAIGTEKDLLVVALDDRSIQFAEAGNYRV